MKKKVAVGISGGVDSSVAAYLLSSEYDVVGVTLLMHGDAPENAARVCRELGIPHRVFDVRQLFFDRVIKNFIAEYHAARTPNPCVWCNYYMKFGAMLEIADSLGAEYVATGHYARLVESESGELFPARAICAEKDQTYALYRLRQRVLRRALFPLGELSKARVREIAGDMGLVSAKLRDSLDICFVPDGDYAAFVEEHSEKSLPGDFIGPGGEVLGSHRGLIHYTVGQRRGLGIAYSERLYVARLDPVKNEVILGLDGVQNTELVTARDVTFISDREMPKSFLCSAKIRYNSPAAPAEVTWDGKRLCAKFASPQRGAAPGQSLVLYDGDLVIGGGIIE